MLHLTQVVLTLPPLKLRFSPVGIALLAHLQINIFILGGTLRFQIEFQNCELYRAEVDDKGNPTMSADLSLRFQ